MDILILKRAPQSVGKVVMKIDGVKFLLISHQLFILRVFISLKSTEYVHTQH